jgi:hypothetical protein
VGTDDGWVFLHFVETGREMDISRDIPAVMLDTDGFHWICLIEWEMDVGPLVNGIPNGRWVRNKFRNPARV